MSNMYYVPTIEEFHVGFIYQFKTLSEWEDRVFNTNDGGYYNNVSEIVEGLREDSIRVKYLNIVDIIALNLIVISIERGSICAKDVHCNYNFKYNLNTKKLTVTEVIRDPGNELNINNPVRYSLMIFRGIIKNYNELKKLLEQLKIH